MITRKLSLDLSSLWENPTGRFVVRHLDTSEEVKRTFAKRIKETAPYYTIRKTNGPTIQEIYDVLGEINPIIFGESQNTRDNSYRNFNLYPSVSIAGWKFKNLCKAIYQTIILKRGLTNEEMKNIASLSCYDYTRLRTFIDANMSLQTRSDEQRLTPITEIGLNDIANATQQAISGGANRVPDEMFGYDEAMDIADEIVNSETVPITQMLNSLRDVSPEYNTYIPNDQATMIRLNGMTMRRINNNNN